jgi:hypothetical protein
MFKDKACIFTKHNPEKKQSDPGTSPPPVVGTLEASPPRSTERSFALLLAKNRHRWSPPLRSRTKKEAGQRAQANPTCRTLSRGRRSTGSAKSLLASMAGQGVDHVDDFNAAALLLLAATASQKK